MIITRTDRLTSRHFRLDDGPAMDHIFGDPEVMRYGRGVQTPQWVRNWLRGWVERYSQAPGLGLWAVVENSSGDVVGYCGLFPYPDVGGQPEIEVGYRLARPFWGRGYATEAARAVRDYAFGTLRLPRLVALIDPSNVASIRVAEKLGLRHERDVTMPGSTHADRVYAIARPAIE